MGHRYIHIEGPDGSGKSSIVEAVHHWLRRRHYKVFNLRTHLKRHPYPKLHEIKKYDVIVAEEPTQSMFGRAITKEIIKGGILYNPLTIAHAFAIDREMLYKRAIIPCLNSKKIIVQERGFLSTLVYQSLQGGLGMAQLLELPGNKLALQYPPSFVMVVTAKPSVLLRRLHKRERHERSLFETRHFVEKINKRYENPKIRKLLKKLKIEVETIDTTHHTIELTIAEGLRVFHEFMRRYS